MTEDTEVVKGCWRTWRFLMRSSFVVSNHTAEVYPFIITVPRSMINGVPPMYARQPCFDGVSKIGRASCRERVFALV